MNEVEFFSQILDSLPVFIGLVNERQEYEFVNQTYVEQYGMSKESIVGLTVKELNGDEEYEKSREMIETVLRGQHVEFEYSINKKCYRINYLPRFQDGNVSGYFIISADITQLKNTTSKLQRSIRELQLTRSSFEDFAGFAHANRIASVGAMAVGLAHDISQPISSINILVDALNASFKKIDVDAKVEKLVDDIQQQIQFVADIINRLKRFSSGKISERKEYQISNILKESIAMVRPRIYSNEIQLDLDIQDEDTLVLVDGIELQQVAVNLLANAIDSVATIDAPKRIQIQCKREDADFCSFRVIDNGPGLSEEITEDLFHAFDSHKEHGSGIGLAISYTLVAQNGGVLELEHNGDAQTTFLCKLPIVS